MSKYPKPCPECGRPFVGSNMKAHLESHRRGTVIPNPGASAEERFWAKVDKSGECWVWTASLNYYGYGRFHAGQETGMTTAHRWSYAHANGPIPEGMFVLHSCDNPPCVNPAHLRLGTHLENMADRTERKRGHGSTKTHCPHGHEYTPENTIMSDGRRRCRECNQRRSREAYQRRKDRADRVDAEDTDNTTDRT